MRVISVIRVARVLRKRAVPHWWRETDRERERERARERARESERENRKRKRKIHRDEENLVGAQRIMRVISVKRAMRVTTVRRALHKRANSHWCG